ncbi:TPA: dynamin family protein [Campylobacter jejuni]|uniref:dynamin family protein n=1 Tax=Campylobacter jejuni TaxID=197 RepID=UPI000F804188|nr:dynamin family protein [Campylobacter jejuni]RTK00223.1 hypothetical protein C3H36_03610 [Campylobacter jejuni]HEF7224074.1 dynamin family protein [Campylobacter jejuni]
MQIIKKFHTLEDFVVKHDLKFMLVQLQEDLAIPSALDLEQWFKAREEEAKELKLGIIGRVKAGKSSLLNAIFFSGQDILPKAATPMTAALTVLEFDTKLGAKAEFFTEEDVNFLKKEHDAFTQNLQKEIQNRVNEARKKHQEKNKTEVFNEQEATDKARRSVLREYKSSSLFASYEQYEKIKQSNTNLNDLKEEISASSLDEFQNILKDYVGERGKYMPFTKSTTLKINLESLKELKIIDSPGINDPIISREERTKKLLKNCDAVFLISPAGQFISNEDLNLLDRVSNKEGVCEFKILASQVDNQLYGDTKIKGGYTLDGALETIASNLKDTQNNSINTFKNKLNSENIKKTCDNLAQSSIIYTSSICHAMFENFDKKETWDANMQQVWTNLQEHYFEFFKDDENAKANLKKLANIEVVKENLNQIRANKDKIIQTKITEYTQAKYQTFQEYTQNIDKLLEEKINELNSKDLAELENQLKNLSSKKQNASHFLEDKYEDVSFNFTNSLKEQLKQAKSEYFQEAKNSVKDSTSEKTTSREVSTSRWWNPFSWGSSKTVYSTYQTINASDARDSLETMIEALQDLLNNEIKKQKIKWKNDLYAKLLGTIREQLGDENLDLACISKTIKNIIASIPTPEINYSDKLPSELRKSGILERYEADEFIDNARTFIGAFSKEVISDINALIKQTEGNLKAMNITTEIFSSYERELEKLKNELSNKELAIDKYNNMRKELKKICECSDEL